MTPSELYQKFNIPHLPVPDNTDEVTFVRNLTFQKVTQQPATHVRYSYSTGQDNLAQKVNTSSLYSY